MSTYVLMHNGGNVIVNLKPGDQNNEKHVFFSQRHRQPKRTKSESDSLQELNL